ncbi:AMP-binding protein [Salipiger sp. 1_MG-2023]|uniref:AMP-binding protein n=1 Tax=Salipiger sp. 1_MG-2023 TaxID=3062665 RepID=UPI0026E319B1|nr:AMP-binding protein [Salipiger sp. 1_MG-2023]MDO6588171.1 AMP-binding protein [Salipiger sp. 1_MG-2023]
MDAPVHLCRHADRANRLANYLTGKGARKGDRVLIRLPRVPEWQIAMVGCNKIGATPIACVTMLTKRDVSYRLEHSRRRGGGDDGARDRQDHRRRQGPAQRRRGAGMG